ncbi:WD40 repeat domain-containing protein [Thiotrichales bacterium HSG1]|nr:WD40 repeat domain-containing protein [Thiotrichales bacterium HSG1]
MYNSNKLPITGNTNPPYIGLRSFKRSDSRIFFGREKHTIQLIEKLANEKFIAIVGESGYGKSSLAYAGLLSGLDAGFMHGRHWWTVDMRPKMSLANSPFANLAEALLEEGTTDNDVLGEYKVKFSEKFAPVSSLQEKVSLTPYSLSHILYKQPLPPHHNLLILVDQFEEIFTHYEGGNNDDEKKKNREDAKNFIRLLLNISRKNESVYVVITMRSEYLGKCAVFENLSEHITKGIFLIPPMTDEELRDAIKKPAQSFGRTIELDLVEQIIKDTKNQEEKTDILPSIQHILMRMCNDNKNLTKSHYGLLGKLGDSLSGCADYVYYAKEKKSIEEQKKHQKTIRILFTCITERKNGLYIRRPTKLSVISNLAGVGWEDIAKIIELFRDKKRRFLKPHLGEVLTEDSIIDITHEVLIHKWEDLREWVNEEKEFIYTYNHLNDRAVEWDEAKKNDGKLWSNKEYLRAKELFDQKGSTIEEWVKHNCKKKADSFELVKEFLEKGEEKRKEELKKKQNAEIAIAEAKRLKAENRLKNTKLKSAYSLIIAIIIGLFATGYFAKKNYDSKQKTEKAFLKQRASQFENAEILASNENFITTKQILKDNFDSEPKLSNSNRHAHNLLNWFSNLKGATPKQTFKGAKAQLHTIAISPDGKTIAAAGEYGKVVLFDKETEQLKSLKDHTDTVEAVVFDSQGKWLASSGDDKQIIFWSLPNPNREELYRLQASNKVWALAVSPDGKLLASGGNDNNISLWDKKGKLFELLDSFEGHTGDIFSLAFSPNGNLLASSSSDKTVRLWDVETAQEIHAFKHTNKIKTVAFSSDAKLLAAGGDDGEVYLYKTNSKQLQHTFKGHRSEIFGLSFIENDKYLVSASSDKNLRLWDVNSGVTLQVLQGHTARVTDVTTYKNQIFSSSNDRTVKSWNPLPLANQYNIDLQEELSSTAISPDGKKVAVGLADGRLRQYSLENRELIWESTDDNKHKRDVQRLAFNLQGNLLVSVSLDKMVKVWQDGKLQRTFNHQDSVSSVTFAPNSNLIVTTSYDGQIGLFNPDTGEANFIKQAHAGEEINSVVFDADGRHLLTASDQEIRLWQIQDNSLKQLKTLTKSESTILWAAISPNGKRYATVGRDNLVKIYSTEDGKKQHKLPGGHDDSVMKAIFSPDNDQIATVSGDGTLRFWDLTTTDVTEIFKLRLPIKNKPPLWDFDFKCTSNGCWIAVPLTNGKLMLYDMGHIYD